MVRRRTQERVCSPILFPRRRSVRSCPFGHSSSYSFLNSSSFFSFYKKNPVITYILLCGYCPFAGDTDYETLNLVQVGKLEFPSPEWDTISKDAKDFVRKLLNRDDVARPTAAQALKHPFIATHVVEPGIPPPRPFTYPKTQSLSDVSLTRPMSAVTELRLDSTRCTAFQKFLAAIKMKKALARASNDLTPNEATLLRDIFQRIDQDQDGRITTMDLDDAIQTRSFSSIVQRHLKQMKKHLIRYPSVHFDIRPFIPMVLHRAKSDSAAAHKL